MFCGYLLGISTWVCAVRAWQKIIPWRSHSLFAPCFTDIAFNEVPSEREKEREGEREREREGEGEGEGEGIPASLRHP